MFAGLIGLIWKNHKNCYRFSTVIISGLGGVIFGRVKRIVKTKRLKAVFFSIDRFYEEITIKISKDEKPGGTKQYTKFNQN